LISIAQKIGFKIRWTSCINKSLDIKTFINIPGIIKDPLWNGKSYHNIYLHQQALQQANENGKIIDHHQRHIFVSIITSLRNKHQVRSKSKGWKAK
jgi:hypothetical protein